MASLLDSATISSLTGIYDQAYQLFSSGSNSNILVVKQSIMQVNNLNANILPGYTPDSNNITDITYINVTGVYPAVVFYPRSMSTQWFIKFPIDYNAIYAKVKQDAKDYILQGKTEHIIIDNIYYIPELSYNVDNYLGSKYYIFKLNVTK